MKGAWSVALSAVCVWLPAQQGSPTQPAPANQELPDVADERDLDEPGAEVAARVLAGGRFETSRYRRTADGVLEFDYIADIGGAHDGAPRWQPLCGEELDFGLRSTDLLGFAALLYHGPDDLLAMTDAAFHLERCGYETSDVALRQLLPSPLPDAPAARRAAVLDRMVAIDLLRRRGCRNARGELLGLAGADQPPLLRQRARLALATLDGRPGEPGVERQRLAAGALRVPEAFDACLVVDHARLPDLGWLARGLPRLYREQLAGIVGKFGRPTTAAMRNGCQRRVDNAAELPFAFVHRFGQVRLDHSTLFVAMHPEAQPPIAFAWQAAGSFEPERFRDAKLPASMIRDGWADAALDVEAAHARGTFAKVAFADADQGRDRRLLGNGGAALRLSVPAASAVWQALDGAPGATEAVVEVTFAPTATAEVRLRGGEQAQAWRAFASRLDRPLAHTLQAALPGRDHETAYAGLIAALRAAEVSDDGDDVLARISLAGLTADDLLAMLRVAVVNP
ncbi:MAG: hypothetical protein KAI24_26540 [Planctomycetes bacterium]|nr:hypothetical protein [Planctomycetota bacterium]